MILKKNVLRLEVSYETHIMIRDVRAEHYVKLVTPSTILPCLSSTHDDVLTMIIIRIYLP